MIQNKKQTKISSLGKKEDLKIKIEDQSLIF